MAEIFKKIGSIVLTVLMLVSFTGILMERDFCQPCGSASEELHIFAPILESGNSIACHCHEQHQAEEHKNGCCNSKTEHCDIVKISYARISTTFLQISVKYIAKPLLKIIALILTPYDSSSLLISKMISLRSSDIIEAPPNIVSQTFICQYLI